MFERLANGQKSHDENTLRQREEKERFEEREDRNTTTATIRDNDMLQSQLNMATPENRYNIVMQAAMRRVADGIQKLETRLEKREMDATNRLNSIMAKRPGKVRHILTRGKASKTWRDAVKKQSAAVDRIRKQKSTVYGIRTQASNYQRQIQAWVRARALRIDKDTVLCHDAERERNRQALEQERIDLSRLREPERGHEVQRGRSMERQFGTV